MSLSEETNEEVYEIGRVFQTHSLGGVLLTPRLASHRLRDVCRLLGESRGTTRSGKSSGHLEVWCALALLYDNQEAYEFACALNDIDGRTARAQYPLFETILCGGGGVEVTQDNDERALSWIQFQGVDGTYYIREVKRRADFFLAYACYAYEIGALLDADCVARFENDQHETVWNEQLIALIVPRLVADYNRPNREELFLFHLSRSLPISFHLASFYAHHLALLAGN